MTTIEKGIPPQQGLYDPRYERDSCGLGALIDIKGAGSHGIIERGLKVLKNMKHRGAVGADESTGDGSGIMLQIPHDLLSREADKLGFSLPAVGEYAVGMAFLPREPFARLYCEGVLERIAGEEELEFLGWRDVPVQEKACGVSGRATRPAICQFFVKGETDSALDRKLLILRKRVQKEISLSGRPYMDYFYICSLSTRQVVYKGQILGEKLDEFYTDLQDPDMKSTYAIVHERYSTNTFPLWRLAHPFRLLAHNGEINTIRGNTNWMNAWEGAMHSETFGKDFGKILPIIEEGGSDSARLDNVLEFFLTNGIPLEHTMMMLIPEAWQHNDLMSDSRKAFYEYHARVMEPWDGPAALIFSDGRKIGAMVDRNGLRPLRYSITDDEMLIASEAGVLEIDQAKVIRKGILRPGKMMIADTVSGKIMKDDEIKESVCGGADYSSWLGRNMLRLDDIPGGEERIMSGKLLTIRQKVFGYTKREIADILMPMACSGEEPIGSMGWDWPIAALSDIPHLLFDYFRQGFAQVTNPPIDSIREKSVMSLIQYLGGYGNRADKIETEQDRECLKLKNPVLSNKEMAKLRGLDNASFKSTVLPMTFQVEGGTDELRKALTLLCSRAEKSVERGYNILILSDRNIGLYTTAIPSLLALGAVHHHLIRKKLRTKIDIVIESGDARDVMHLALLVGYGAKAVNPYLAFETLRHEWQTRNLSEKLSLERFFCNYRKALCKGLLKILAKMGISTLQSYHGAQIFEAIGLSKDIIDMYFCGTPVMIPGIDMKMIEEETLQRHYYAYEALPEPDFSVNTREKALFDPVTAMKLREACKTGNYDTYLEYADMVDRARKDGTVRGQLDFKERTPIPLDEAEPVENILRRFTTGAMSLGSISRECHENLAIAMNRIGARSNSGEGGEDPARYGTSQSRENRESACKQIASGRFGVDISYLVNCNELQIKMAQGAKPGEGGHLPGNKVSEEIARLRHSLPGIDLISPPPHHDIYSIEDLAQLVYDLRNANSDARINVKLASRAGIGTIATGVVKAHADVVTVCGHDGGTGATPISSMKYAGSPWEIGLSEVQQTLMLNGLRDRVRLQVDGKLMTGKDVVVAALLGAEEYGFTSAALVASGCRMCRQCNKNTCPAGIATQNRELRKKFVATPEDVINYFRFVATDVRKIMASLGFRNIDAMIGRVDILRKGPSCGRKASVLDFSSILYRPELPSRIGCRYTRKWIPKLDRVLDRQLIASLDTQGKSEGCPPVYRISNTDRSVGTMLSGYIVRKRNGEAPGARLQHEFSFRGTAGQSFGAFLVEGVTLRLEGDTNDYLGKGLSGGTIIVKPDPRAFFRPEDNVIAGNTILYGAISGEAYLNGRCGERFAVRNSGACAVVEGIGNHGCEYMTGGVVVIIGPTGSNFGAGMSGGIAFVLDEYGDFEKRCNHQLVEIRGIENRKDEHMLTCLLEKYLNYTDSPKAGAILGNWDIYKRRFLKICSPEYSELAF